MNDCPVGRAMCKLNGSTIVNAQLAMQMHLQFDEMIETHGITRQRCTPNSKPATHQIHILSARRLCQLQDGTQEANCDNIEYAQETYLALKHATYELYLQSVCRCGLVYKCCYSRRLHFLPGMLVCSFFPNQCVSVPELNMHLLLTTTSKATFLRAHVHHNLHQTHFFSTPLLCCCCFFLLCAPFMVGACCYAPQCKPQAWQKYDVQDQVASACTLPS